MEFIGLDKLANFQLVRLPTTICQNRREHFPVFAWAAKRRSQRQQTMKDDKVAVFDHFCINCCWIIGKIRGTPLKCPAPNQMGRAPDGLGWAPNEMGRIPNQMGRTPYNMGCTPNGLGHGPNEMGRGPNEMGRAPNQLGCAPNEKGDAIFWIKRTHKRQLRPE